MKKITFILLLLIFNFSLFTSVLAQSPTPIGTASPELVQQNIQDRIEKVVQEKATASGEILASKSVIKRGWVGTLEDLAQTTLTIKTKSGTHQASFSDATVFVDSPGKKTLKSTDLEIGADVIAIGFVNGNGVMDLRRLIVVTKAQITPQRFVKLATILNFDPAKKIITVKTADEELILRLATKTLITQGKNLDKADTKALVPDAKLIFINQADSTLLHLHLF